MEKLRPGEVELRAPKTMVQGSPYVVTLQIAKDTLLPSGPAPQPGQASKRKPTKVGDSALVCLQGGAAFEIEHTPEGGECNVQLVIRGTENRWQWLVTPKTFGERLMLVASIKALLAGVPGRAIYTDSVAVGVSVKPCPLTDTSCLQAWLTTWQGILTAVGGIVTLLGGWLAWLFRKRRSASTGTG